MDKIWKYGILLFMLIGIAMHNEKEMMNAIYNTPKITFDLVLTLILSACLWNGFLNIIEHSHFMDYFKFILKPILRIIYGPIILKEDIYTLLSSNIIANLLGLGTLATMSGIKAFQTLNEYNIYSYPNRAMLTLVIINTVGFTLYPSNIIMLRKEFNSTQLYAFYPYMIVISISILIIGLIIQRIIDHG